MPLPKPRNIQINGNFRTIRGNKILDTFEQTAQGWDEGQALIGSVKAKIQTEDWVADPGSSLFSLEILMSGFRNMTLTETIAVASYDKSQTAEFQEYQRLKDKFE